MPFSDIFKISRKTFFNPAAWFGYQEFKQFNQLMYFTTRGLFRKPPEGAPTETFAEAQARVGISDKEVPKAQHLFFFYALLFFLIGLGLFIYSFFLLFYYHTFGGLILGLATSALSLTYALRYDFWSLQMKTRSLNLTLADWRSYRFGGKGTGKS